jgi:hypothetical protein
MREICDLADGLGFTLTLCTSIAKLVPYYEGFGFKTTNWSRMSPTYEVTYFARTPRPIT